MVSRQESVWITVPLFRVSPRCIQNNDLHLYVYGLLLLKEQRLVDTKFKICLSVRCAKGISSSYNKIRSLGNESVLLDPQLERITAAEKEKVTAEKFSIDIDRLIVN